MARIDKDPESAAVMAILESAKVRLEAEKKLGNIKMTYDDMREIATNICMSPADFNFIYDKIDAWQYIDDSGKAGFEAYQRGEIVKVFRKLAREQIVKWRGINLSLSDIGSMAFSSQRDRSDFYDFRHDFFITGCRPGATTVVTGVPDSGKTHTAMNEIGAVALSKGINLTSNVEVINFGNIPKEYIPRFRYAIKLSEILDFACDNCILGLKQQGEPYMTYKISDELVLFRQKMRQSSNKYIGQKMLTHLWRHFGVHEVAIEQIKSDTPPEILAFMSHYIENICAVNKDFVYFKRYDVSKSYNFKNVPSWEMKRDSGMPYLEYPAKRPTTLDIDVSVPELLTRVLSSEERMKQFSYAEYSELSPEGRREKYVDAQIAMYEDIKKYIDKKKGIANLTEEQMMTALFHIHRINAGRLSYAYLANISGIESDFISQGKKSESAHRYVARCLKDRYDMLGIGIV